MRIAVCPDYTDVINSTVFQKVEKINGLDFIHKENDFNDFERDRLLFQDAVK